MDEKFGVKDLIIAGMIGAVIGALILNFYSPSSSKMKFNFPYTAKVDPTIGISCKAMAGSYMYGTSIDPDNGVFAELFKGKDQIAIEVDKDNKFRFITNTSVKAGQTQSDEGWLLIKNSEKYLFAVLNKADKSMPIRNSTDTFMLNKENGMGIWSKNRLTDLGSETPVAQSYILNCN